MYDGAPMYARFNQWLVTADLLVQRCAHESLQHWHANGFSALPVHSLCGKTSYKMQAQVPRPSKDSEIHANASSNNSSASGVHANVAYL
jgi:hypothetical protein